MFYQDDELTQLIEECRRHGRSDDGHAAPKIIIYANNIHAARKWNHLPDIGS